MANTADIKAVITAEDKASSVLKNFGDNAGRLGSSLAGAAEFAAKSLAVAGAAAVGFGVVSVKAFSESEDLIAQTNAVLKSTGSVAGVTADQVTKLATAWQKQSKFSDEAVRGAENILLTFTNITSDIFPQTTQAVLDISTALHEDLQSASIQVGKALQDPVLGVTALRRVGVNFSEKQRDVIKALVDTGQSAKAQQIILAELNKEFGGSAVAAGNTFSGSLAELKNSLNDVEEKIGKVIVEKLSPFVTKALEAVAALDWDKIINRTIAILTRFANALQIAYQRISAAYTAVNTYLVPGIERFIGIVETVAGVLNTMLMPSFRQLVDTIETRLMPQIIRLWNTLEPGLTDALKVIAVVVGALVVAAMWLLINVLNVAISIIGGVIGVVQNLIAWFGNMAGAGINMVNAIIGAFRGLYNGISGAVGGVIGAVSGILSRTVSAIWGYFGQFVDAGWGLIKAFASGILGAAEIPVNAAKSVLGKVRNLLPFSDAKEGPLSDLTKSGRKFSETFAGGMIQGKDLVSQAGSEVLGSIMPASASPSSQPGQSYASPAPASAGSNINVSFSGIFMGSEQEFRKLAIKVFQAGADAASMQNLDVSAMTTQHWRRI